MSIRTVRRRQFVWATAVVLLLGAIWVTRTDTAEAGAPSAQGVDVVYVAVGTNFPDALGSGAAGGVNGAPIILVPTNPPIPTPTEAELTRLDPKSVIIVGGEAVVSPAMESALAALLPGATIDRLAGANRYDTNVLLSQSVFPVEAWATIPPQAFTGSANDPGGAVIGNTLAYHSSSFRLYAPIQLPDGATILELVAEGQHTDAGNLFDTVIIDINRVVAPGNVQELAAVEGEYSVGGVFEESTTSISNPVVDNSQYSYFVTADGTASQRQIGTVRVRYRLGTPGG